MSKENIKTDCFAWSNAQFDLVVQYFMSNLQETRNWLYNLPSNTRTGATSLPSNTWIESEIERLKAEVRRLSEENALLVERDREYHLEPSLGALRERVLSSLKLGKQAPGYKAAQKALERFITELTELT